MFVARNNELNKLEKLYKRLEFQCVIIYGRRRVGKTALIREFCKNKKTIFFIAREANDKLNLENFSMQTMSTLSNTDSLEISFKSWDDAFNFIGKKAKDEKIILVIDEYPYLASANRSISSILQAHIDIELKDSKLFIILCGSSMSFMEEQVLGYESPLYGRRTAQFKIEPLNFFDSKKFHVKYNIYDRALIYGITGGIPQYLLKLNNETSIKENIIENILDENSYLFEEPSNILKQELREPAIYNTLIEAIAKGATRVNEIATKTGIESNKCSKYLGSLISLGIVKREKPVCEKQEKRSIYVLEDQLFRFWYRFIPNNLTSIVSGLSDYVYDNNIKPQIPRFMGSVFEKICIQYMIKMNVSMKLPFVFSNIGRWWGNNPILKRQEEVDIIAYNEDKAIICECKWNNEPVGSDVIDDLIAKGNIFKYREKHFYVFSKIGFKTSAFERISDNIKLISFIDMDLD
ncbi:MAG TPA: ATP-binding protein [Clostridiaceae bacterium]